MPCGINITHCQYCRGRINTDQPSEVREHVRRCGPDPVPVLPDPIRTRPRG